MASRSPTFAQDLKKRFKHENGHDAKDKDNQDLAKSTVSNGAPSTSIASTVSSSSHSTALPPPSAASSSTGNSPPSNGELPDDSHDGIYESPRTSPERADEHVDLEEIPSLGAAIDEVLTHRSWDSCRRDAQQISTAFLLRKFLQNDNWKPEKYYFLNNFVLTSDYVKLLRDFRESPDARLIALELQRQPKLSQLVADKLKGKCSNPLFQMIINEWSRPHVWVAELLAQAVEINSFENPSAHLTPAVLDRLSKLSCVDDVMEAGVNSPPSVPANVRYRLSHETIASIEQDLDALGKQIWDSPTSRKKDPVIADVMNQFLKCLSALEELFRL